jgi:hypothetical protein
MFKENDGYLNFCQCCILVSKLQLAYQAAKFNP